MTAVSEVLRSEVTIRAGRCCEYCLLPTTGQVAPFPVDHIVPCSRGGKTVLDNLALACPHCNSHKWAFVDGIDPETELAVPLFHPRRDRWSDHFRWADGQPELLEGMTARGRATISRLRMNSSDMLALRRLLSALGIILSRVD